MRAYVEAIVPAVGCGDVVVDVSSSPARVPLRPVRNEHRRVVRLVPRLVQTLRSRQ